jgi:hypothetical protein
MAGILANSASYTMTSSDTAVDQALSGWIRNERITLSTSPAASSSYVWSLTNPYGSSSAKSYLSSTTSSGPNFVPDIGGTYVVTCKVNGTTDYVLRASVLDTASVEPVEALRMTPRADAQVAAPSLGVVMYFSSTQQKLCIKTSSDAVFSVNTTYIP